MLPCVGARIVNESTRSDGLCFQIAHGASIHSAFAPDALTTFAHFAVSDLM
jgi:hypothetical protein